MRDGVSTYLALTFGTHGQSNYLVVCVVAFLVYFFARCISGIIDFCQWFRFVQDFLDYAETFVFLVFFMESLILAQDERWRRA